MAEHRDQYAVSIMSKVLEIPRSSYYQSFYKKETKRAYETKEICKQILEIHKASKQRYDAPKIHQVLKKKGIIISLKRVQRLMRKLGVFSITIKKYKPFSSKQPVTERENLLEQDFSTTRILQKWVTDITYIHTIQDGWCYLASVLDLHSKKIVGYSFSKKMTKTW